jgi:hypothetical protein
MNFLYKLFTQTVDKEHTNCLHVLKQRRIVVACCCIEGTSQLTLR